jgi:signal transduction histidine kinase
MIQAPTVIPVDKSPDLLQRLRAFDIFTEVADEALLWMIEKSTYVMYPRDALIFRDEQEVDHMQVLLTGGFKIIRETENRKQELGMWTAPQITGVLPFSRMKKTSAKGVCLADTYTLLLHRDCFVEMVNISYPLTQALVSVMTNRVRDFQQMRLMDEKLMALGKMSAGLAHELNNPASAMVRSSQELHRHLVQTPERFKSVITMRVDLDSVHTVNEVLFERIRSAKDREDLSLMEREERTDELLDWLDDRDVAEAENMVDTFVDYDFTVSHFERMAEVIPREAIGPVFGWIETNLTTESLVNEIQTASGRIAELVKSIKTYSHMDQEPSMELVDVHEGIKSTVTMLYHMVKRKNITICKDLDQDLPRVKALAGELNQVWTNLLSNAIDALPERGGDLIIRTFQERDCVCVEVEDNGPGVPDDIQSRIFEPFFTTKGIGEGTGMGLDIVRRVIDRHNGSVKLDSRPGRTVFRVCFPTG